jgi:quinol monooxygenase YgiN
VAIQAEFAYPGVRRDSYDSMIPEVEAKLPSTKGFIAHSAAESADGFRVVEVWESEAAMRAWLQDTIAPMMASAGAAAPQPTGRALHHLIVK